MGVGSLPNRTLSMCAVAKMQVRFTAESGHWREGLGMSALGQKRT